MKRFAVVLMSLMLGCSGFIGPGSKGGVVGMYQEAKVAYVAALEAAVSEVVLCHSQVPITMECHTLTLKVRDANRQASPAIQTIDNLMAGFPPDATCDEATEPGCTERLRLMQISALLGIIQEVTFELTRGR